MGDRAPTNLSRNICWCVFERIDIMVSLSNKIVKYRTCCLVAHASDRARGARLHRGASERLGRSEDGDRQLLRPREEDLEGTRDSPERGRPSGLSAVPGGKTSWVQRGCGPPDAPEEPDPNEDQSGDDYGCRGRGCPST